jgi:hypothetical protein
LSAISRRGQYAENLHSSYCFDVTSFLIERAMRRRSGVHRRHRCRGVDVRRRHATAGTPGFARELPEAPAEGTAEAGLVADPPGRGTIESAIAPVPEKRFCSNCIDIALQQADRADLPAASTRDRRRPLRRAIGLSHIISRVSARRDPRRFLRTKHTRETP